MRPDSRIAVTLAVCCLLSLSGCLELVKRTAPPWEREIPSTGTAQEETPTMSPSEHRAPVDSAAAGMAPVGGSGALLAAKAAPSPRTKQASQFALWSIRRGMWNEARKHLEKQAARDSVSASLQNNLGVVYEYLSLDDRAGTAYRKAMTLAPRNGVYAENFRRFRRYKVAVKKRPGGSEASTDSSSAPADTSITGP